jgi:NADH-quinone oxidoreductase subunit G
VGCDPRDDSPILDLRIRKGVRRNGVKLVIASARPTALEANATLSVRYAPRADGEFVAALERALGGAQDVGADIAGLAALLRDGGEDVVIIFSERIGTAAAGALARIAGRLGVADRAGAGLLELPAGSNGRGLREAGAVPDAGPGYASLDLPGRGAAEMAAAAAAGDITALHLFESDPIRDQPNRGLWERALHSAALVVAHASVLTDGLREHATVIFPAESHAEKEGTVVHPDGRLQRLRIAIAHPGEVRSGWAVLAEIARRCGLDTGVQFAGDAFEQLVAAVPVYEGLTLEEIGGRGVRWPERPQAQAMAPAAGSTVPAAGGPAGRAPTPVAPSPAVVSANGHLALGTYRPIWASAECEVSPALKFLIPAQQVELSPADAQRLQIADGEDVVIAQNGTRLNAKAVVRSAVPAGSAFLADGLPSESANALTEPLIEVMKR